MLLSAAAAGRDVRVVHLACPCLIQHVYRQPHLKHALHPFGLGRWRHDLRAGQLKVGAAVVGLVHALQSDLIVGSQEQNCGGACGKNRQ